MVSFLLIAALAATSASTATAKKRLKPLTCAETIAKIEEAARDAAKAFTFPGYTVTSRGHNYGYSETCTRLGRYKRRGTGQVTIYLPFDSDPDYKGLPFYVYTWTETVTRLRGGYLLDAGPVNCRYGVQTGTGIGGARPCPPLQP